MDAPSSPEIGPKAEWEHTPHVGSIVSPQAGNQDASPDFTGRVDLGRYVQPPPHDPGACNDL